MQHRIRLVKSGNSSAKTSCTRPWITAIANVDNTDRCEREALIERIESRNGIHTLEQAEKIGLGSREYELVRIDE